MRMWNLYDESCKQMVRKMSWMKTEAYNLNLVVLKACQNVMNETMKEM